VSTALIATEGLHHVTAVGGDPQRNHLYYGDEQGRPGTLLIS
jgi:hypothetical protein